jgi:hypothetical protein
LSPSPSSWFVKSGSKSGKTNRHEAGRARAVATRDPPRTTASGTANGATNGAVNGSANGAVNGSATRGRSMREMSEEMKKMRAQMEEDEQVHR